MAQTNHAEIQNYGEAYAFLKCRASRDEILREMPYIRMQAKTPANLELTLIEDPSKLEEDQNLMEIVREASEDGMRYALRARLPDATNIKTADELADILNQAYQSPLYCPEKKEPFEGGIVYTVLGKYVFRE
jgi:hypothetical protein